MTRTTLPIALAALALVLGACGDDTPRAAPRPAVAKAKPAAAKPAAEAAAAEAPPVAYSYNPIGKRDPFRSPNVDRLPTPGGGPETGSCDEPLCRFDLDDLTLVAVVSGDANPLAMLEDRDHVGYLVRRNSKIGRQGGKVTQVLRECIVVTSFITGSDGKAQPTRDELCVKTDQKKDRALDLMQGKYRE